MKNLSTSLKIAVRRRFASRNNYRFTGLMPVRARAADTDGAPRLNLVIMGIRGSALFGGSDTALRLFQTLAGRFPRARLIVQSEDGSEFDRARWPGWEIDAPGSDHPKSVGFLGRADYTPAVHADDHFIATNWMSAHFVRAARAVQPAHSPGRFLYLIQDFEPGFYTWSGRHLYAASTYARTDDVIAVFNTQLLHDYFRQVGFSFERSFVFEPQLSPGLATFLPRLAGHEKQRLMLIYGRPLAQRNAFDMVVESLDVWARTDPDARLWRLVSLGEVHKTVTLPGGLQLRSGGKLSLEAYAAHLLDAAVGFSLMVSPHPSYPPLEMAEFGARVVTNSYANKDLSRRVPSITSVAEPTPAMLGQALVAACQAFSSRGHATAGPVRAFLGTADEFPFAGALCDAMLGCAPTMTQTELSEGPPSETRS